MLYFQIGQIFSMSKSGYLEFDHALKPRVCQILQALLKQEMYINSTLAQTKTEKNTSDPNQSNKNNCIFECNNLQNNYYYVTEGRVLPLAYEAVH